MENISIFLENGVPTNVNGIFYIFNSKYYFMYTLKEPVDDEYIQLYVVQVCKEVQDTVKGPVDTGYMLGIETTDAEAWKNVQESITKIVNDKKNYTQSSDIRYLPINMLANLKIVSKNKFKLSKHLIENSFKLSLAPLNSESSNDTIQPQITETPNTQNEITNGVAESNSQEQVNIQNNQNELQNTSSEVNTVSTQENNNDNNEVIIDYRAKFFEEQEKNEQLQEQLNALQEKINSIKEVLQ